MKKLLKKIVQCLDDSELIQHFLIGFFGFMFLLAFAISTYFGNEQFKWGQTVHNLVFLAILSAGFVFGVFWASYCSKRETNMYFVNSNSNFRNQVNIILTNAFAGKALVKISKDGKLYVKVNEDAGFKDIEKRLTEEQLAQGVCGGGLTQGLDGKIFTIEVQEVFDW